MLNGRPVLIVEEEFLIALDLQRMLETLDCGQTLFARNVAEARALRAHWPHLALAIVEYRSDTADSEALRQELLGLGIPTVVATGHSERKTGATLATPVLVKPFSETSLAGAVAGVLSIQS